ncbi:RNase adapter RapZ [Roseinatronobacter sp.]|uniref:RNase adapter RapZ n=1 Tax=Roseinatronobacter sp. TaxID=1945755 RepID=UPI0025F93A7E|nr:RNase adapter RapZ [Rhodobaca sp.]
MMDAVNKDKDLARLVLLTGPSGAGRSTALKALEDIGFEAIDNMPISLVRPLVGAPLDRPLALVLDPRNRDFSVDALLALVDDLEAMPRINLDLVFLDCPVQVLIRRFSETRRRHPLSPDGTAREGIEFEARLLAPVRLRADVLIETEALTPHDLRARMHTLFDDSAGQSMRVQIESFSYKRGIPAGVDLVFDCRFLKNPHWEAELRRLDGRDPRVAGFVSADHRFDGFFQRIHELVESLLPEYAQEGKSQLTIAFGCTGGQHRSVATVEKLANALAQTQWQVSKRHRELERIATQVAIGENE